MNSYLVNHWKKDNLETVTDLFAMEIKAIASATEGCKIPKNPPYQALPGLALPETWSAKTH